MVTYNEEDREVWVGRKRQADEDGVKDDAELEDSDTQDLSEKVALVVGLRDRVRMRRIVAVAVTVLLVAAAGRDVAAHRGSLNVINCRRCWRAAHLGPVRGVRGAVVTVGIIRPEAGGFKLGRANPEGKELDEEDSE